MPQFALSVNGKNHVVRADSDTPLLWVLRDEFGLTGTKFGCGIGQCGACVVHLDGSPVPSCALQISAVGQGRITTIEGLTERGSAERLQRAWVEHDVPQCGYCQSGMIMAASALLLEYHHPTDIQIQTALAPHICRCGTYLRIRAAIKAASQ
jgi:isoquinoline 1-oxidoreductase subunit alpha